MVGAAYGPYFDDWWRSALTAMEQGTRIPYAVRRLSDHKVVGTTSLYEIKPDYRRCEIGSTFYRPEARGGPVNPACKRLLLGHAFNSGAVRVEIIIDAINPASQAAIRKLGAREEGVLRKHKITWKGRIRDTAQFAVLDEDWPEVRTRLDARLAVF
jgi:N-acetyltransferase